MCVVHVDCGRGWLASYRPSCSSSAGCLWTSVQHHHLIWRLSQLTSSRCPCIELAVAEPAEYTVGRTRRLQRLLMWSLETSTCDSDITSTADGACRIADLQILLLYLGYTTQYLLATYQLNYRTLCYYILVRQSVVKHFYLELCRLIGKRYATNVTVTRNTWNYS